jgi:putative GTP pyrophosphokinase
MPFVKLKYNHAEINRAGCLLTEAYHPSKVSELVKAYDILNNLRASHSYPINTFQANLRAKLKHIDKNAFDAQRLKRTPSIVSKLKRFPKMQLARMQDIDALRAVVKNVESVRKLKQEFVDSRFNHELINEKDYIANPKDSGYRSVHLIYRYKGKFLSDYNGHLLEIQIRTKLQHSWATAVETMGTFLNQSLKASEGADQWLNFFAITSSAFAYLEKCPLIPPFTSLSQLQTYARVKEEAERLEVVDKLKTFGLAVKNVSAGGTKSDYYLLVLNPHEKVVQITGFDRRQLDLAMTKYSEEERKLETDVNSQVVLVKAESLDSLRKAYPNYFLDTHAFLEYVEFISKQIPVLQALDKRSSQLKLFPS